MTMDKLRTRVPLEYGDNPRPRLTQRLAAAVLEKAAREGEIREDVATFLNRLAVSPSVTQVRGEYGSFRFAELERQVVVFAMRRKIAA